MNTRLSHVKRHADIYAAPTTSSFILTKPSSFNRVISSWWLDCGVDNTTMTPLKLGNNDVAAKNTKKGNEITKSFCLIGSNYGLLRSLLPQMNVLYCALYELLYR